MKIRTLGHHEHEAWLELLDGWELADGWRGRDFFRRFIEYDPTFSDENVFVAEESGRLLSTVQIFPRHIRVGTHEVSLGGIGSVFTREEERGKGVARAVLQSCAEAMRERGMDVSLLFTGRTSFYSQFGWCSWGVQASLLERTAETQPPSGRAEVFSAQRDRAEVCALHEAYSGVRQGTVVRDDALWSMSLRLSGNPDEEFLVARSGEAVDAYARAIVLYGFLVIMEVGRTAQGAEALADLLLELQTPREADPLVTAERTSAELRRLAAIPDLANDPGLEAALRDRGVALHRHPDSSIMLRCLDAERLAERIGVALAEGESPNDFLQRVLPAEEFVFWQADRF